MATNLIFFVLAILYISNFSVMAFLSSIHKKMTPAEIFETFGCNENSVPDYQVFPITLPGTRRGRQASDEINLKIELFGHTHDLNFKPSKGHLATKYTPVWLAITDKKAYKNIRYEPLPSAMTNIGDFKMYQEPTRKSAITVFTDADGEAFIEGIISSQYAIKSLPKRLTSNRLKLGDYLVETPVVKRSVNNSDGDDATGYYVAFKIQSPPKDVIRSIPIDLAAKHRNKRIGNTGLGEIRHRQELPEAVYPEILIVLDYNAIRNTSLTHALRFLLALWNGVDSIYTALKQPNIYINIAGIIVAADETATPYIAKNASQNITDNSPSILTSMGQYFYNEQVRFPLEHYDMIIAMTTIKMCFGEINPCRHILGLAHQNRACSSESYLKKYERIGSTAIIHYNWNFGGVRTAAHETAHLFGVRHDDGQGLSADCRRGGGYVMEPSYSYDYKQRAFIWSKCSLDYFSQYFRSKESECLDNKPMWTEPFEEVLPGRWLTLDGQCRNLGYDKYCKTSKLPICQVTGCRAKNSTSCWVHRKSLLVGSNCGEDKYCDKNFGCVPAAEV